MGIRVKRKAEACWRGSVEQGSGQISVGSGAFNGPYSLRSRVGDDPHTNPEELIGAAHAGCFAMSVANLVSQGGFEPTDITTVATVNLEQLDRGFSVTRIELEVIGDVPGIDEDTFVRLAKEAKETCPISRALAGTEITVRARLTTSSAEVLL